MKDRIASFGYAIKGLIVAFKEEPNFRFHIVAVLAVCILGGYLDITKDEWIMIVLLFGMVTITELLNTAIENICDHVTPEQHPKIGRIKDIAAGAVLISAITALIVGGLIFLPYLLN